MSYASLIDKSSYRFLAGINVRNRSQLAVRNVISLENSVSKEISVLVIRHRGHVYIKAGHKASVRNRTPMHGVGKDRPGSDNAPPPAAMLVPPKRDHAAENIESITSKSCRQPYMLASGKMCPGIAPGWHGNNTSENLPRLYRKPLVQAADPAAGQ